MSVDYQKIAQAITDGLAEAGYVIKPVIEPVEIVQSEEGRDMITLRLGEVQVKIIKPGVTGSGRPYVVYEGRLLDEREARTLSNLLVVAANYLYDKRS